MGAEVTGIDVARPLPADLRRQLEEAFDVRKLLCFRDQLLTVDSLVAFARSWSSRRDIAMLAPGDGMADVSIASNADENGRPNGQHPNPAATRWCANRWWRGEPVTATLLYGVEVPSEGGDMLFANVAMEYRALPSTLEEAAADLSASSSAEDSRRAGGGSVPDDVLAFVTRPQFVYRHKWRPRDLLMWDDRCTLHCETPFDAGQELRTVFRTFVAGVPPHRQSPITRN
jgi:alpha-ketoglutarate-dependent taurine dioxygenase